MLSSTKREKVRKKTAGTGPTQRTVVLLRSGDKQNLAKLAQNQNVSSSEIVRRGIQAYQDVLGREEDFSDLLAELNRALDTALEAMRSARAEVAANIASMRELRGTQA